MGCWHRFRHTHTHSVTHIRTDKWQWKPVDCLLLSWPRWFKLDFESMDMCVYRVTNILIYSVFLCPNNMCVHRSAVYRAALSMFSSVCVFGSSREPVFQGSSCSSFLSSSFNLDFVANCLPSTNMARDPPWDQEWAVSSSHSSSWQLKMNSHRIPGFQR